MYFLVKNTLVVFVIAFMVSCSGIKTGSMQLENVTATSVSYQITKDLTDKHQIITIFGQPNDVDLMSNGLEKWTYKFSQSIEKASNFIPVVNLFALGTDDRNKQLVLIFNEDNTVKNYSFTSFDGETKMGLFQQKSS